MWLSSVDSLPRILMFERPRMLSFLGRDRSVAPPGFNRWLVPPAALSIHLAIGQVYSFSIFKNPLLALKGADGLPHACQRRPKVVAGHQGGDQHIEHEALHPTLPESRREGRGNARSRQSGGGHGQKVFL